MVTRFVRTVWVGARRYRNIYITPEFHQGLAAKIPVRRPSVEKRVENNGLQLCYTTRGKYQLQDKRVNKGLCRNEHEENYA